MKAMHLVAMPLFLLTCATVVVAQPLPYYSQTDLTPYWPADNDNSSQSPATITKFSLVNQAKKPITEAAFDGHPSLVNFFFASCPSVCPLLMNKMQSFKRALTAAPNLRLYSFTVTPNEDSPEKLQAYGKAHKLNLAQWDLLTGSRDAIFRLGREVFKADKTVDGGKDASFTHSDYIYLVDAHRRIRGVYRAADQATLTQLRQDLTQLVSEDHGKPR